MISQGEVELSVISKNFFFTFFNLFVVWTITSAATNYYSLLKESLKDTTLIATLLAKYLGTLTQFYTNLIVLQGIGLFPLRLLMFGSVALYPITLMGAKTPRGRLYITKA
jgi:calcium permeable stress-gated cation channel